MKAYGSQSMVAPLRRVIVKRPRDAFRDAAAIEAQWKDLNYTAPPDLAAAEKEFDAFVRVLEESGAEVLSLPRTIGPASIPSIPTTRSSSRMPGPSCSRPGRSPAAAKARRRPTLSRPGGSRSSVTIDGTATAEGGDMLWLDHDTLAVGRGFRTNAAGVAALRKLLGPLGVEVLDFHLPFWSGPGDVLHLQSFISLLDTDLAVVYKKLLPVPLYRDPPGTKDRAHRYPRGGVPDPGLRTSSPWRRAARSCSNEIP